MINAYELDLSTKFKGTLTELQVQTYFLSKGYNISVPICEESKYDLILDTGKQLLRIQIKTARLSEEKNSIRFNCRSTCCNTRENKKRTYSDTEIDYFATYWNDNVYLVPVGETSSEKALHFNVALNQKRSNWSYLEDYDAEVILNSL